MSTKQLKTLGVSSDEEKKFTEQLTKHLQNEDEGVLRKRSDPTAFPIVDPRTVAKHWKSNYASKFNRYSQQSIENIVGAVYEKLKIDHENAKKPPVTTTTPTTPSATKKQIVTKDKAVVKRQKTNAANQDDAAQQLVSVVPGVIINSLPGNGSNSNSNPTPLKNNNNTKTKASFISVAPGSSAASIMSTTSNAPPAGSTMFQKTVFDSDDDGDENNNLNSNNNTMHDEDCSITAHVVNIADDGNNDNQQIALDNTDYDDDEDQDDEDDDFLEQQQNNNGNNNNNNTSTTATQQTPAVVNANSKMNNIYNPNAIPYDQRPPPTKNNNNNNKKQTKDQIVKQIQQDAINNMSESAELKRAYRVFVRQGYQHRAAEALARKQMGMEHNVDHLPPTLPKNFAKNAKGNQTDQNKSNTVTPVRSSVTLNDVGGIDNIIQDIREMIEYPLTHPEIYSHLGVNPPRGVLLHGPPGCGKTLLANAIAGELQLPMIKLQATEIVSKLSGESENKIRQVFQDAAQHAPCIIFIDELDVIASKKDNDDSSDMKRRIVTQLMVSIDALNDATNGTAAPLLAPNETGEGLTPEELLARPDVAFNPSTGKMEIVKSTSEKALEMNENSELMLQSTLANNTNANKTIIVIGATSKVESIDPALRRAGRFDREIAIGIPDEFARTKILHKMTEKMRLAPDCNLDIIGKKTVGFVGADLLALTREAATYAINRIFNNNELWLQIFAQQQQAKDSGSNGLVPSEDVTKQLAMQLMSLSVDEKKDDDDNGNDNTMNDNDDDNNKQEKMFNDTIDTNTLTKTQKLKHELDVRSKISDLLRQCGTLTSEQLQSFNIAQDDFLIASKKVQPTAKREGFATVPETTWADVGALDLLRAELEMAIVQPIQDPELFESLGLNTPAGVLLFGPPGCGKTLVAKAVANASGASFLSVKGPELLNQYVGESERAVRQVFKRAQMCSPCVIFFDELDALVPRRGGGGGGGSQASERVVNQLLTELDGFDDRRHVFVIAATNRPDIIDPAVLRPGRLDKLLFIPLPDADGRYSILLTHTRRTPLSFTEFPGETDDEKKKAMLRQIADNNLGGGYSGADMQALVREATTAALKEYQLYRIQNPNIKLSPKDITVQMKHFDIAFTKVRASVSPQSRREYEQLCERITQGKGVLRKDVHTVEDGSQCGGASR